MRVRAIECTVAGPPTESSHKGENILNEVIADYALYGAKWCMSVPPPEVWAENFKRLITTKTGKSVIDDISLLPISSLYAKQIDAYGKIRDFSIPEEFVSIFTYFDGLKIDESQN